MATELAGARHRVVVVAIDASDNAKDAFEWYLKQVHRADDFVVVCHVPELSEADLPTFSLKHGLAPPIDKWEKAVNGQLEKIKKLEETYENELILRKIKHKVRCESSFKNAGQGIISVADAEKAQLIVVGTRGLDAIRRTFLGSVSDYVIHHSKIPVLICPRSTAATP